MLVLLQVRSYGQHCYKHPEDCEQMTQWLQPLLQEHKVGSVVGWDVWWVRVKGVLQGQAL